MSAGEEHEHQWLPLGNLDVCGVRGCNGYRAATPEAEAALAGLGDVGRLPMAVRATGESGEEGGESDEVPR